MTYQEYRLRRPWLVVMLTLLPWPAVWLGLYQWHSLVLTFVLYHGVCLLPWAVLGRRYWEGTLRAPTARQWTMLCVAVLLVLPLTWVIYARVGRIFIDAPLLLAVMARRGFEARWLPALALYFVPVNAVLEELFWRGVVLGVLGGTPELQTRASKLGAAWAVLSFGAWHYLAVRILVRPGWAEITVAGIIGAGFVLSRIYRRTGSMIVTALWHGLVFDLPVILIFARIVRG